MSIANDGTVKHTSNSQQHSFPLQRLRVAGKGPYGCIHFMHFNASRVPLLFHICLLTSFLFVINIVIRLLKNNTYLTEIYILLFHGKSYGISHRCREFQQKDMFFSLLSN